MLNKILFIITQSEFGGAQHFLAHLVTNLGKDKYKIVVAAGPERDDEFGLLSFLEKKGINVRHLKNLRRAINPLFDFLGLIEIWGLINREKPDVVFLGSSKAGFLGSLAAKLSPQAQTVIYRIGGWAFNDPRPRWQKSLYKFAEKTSARWKDIIIVNADCHQKQAIGLGIRPRKEILTIHNGIDVNNLEFLSKEEAKQILVNKIPDSKFQILNSKIIGTIANFYPAKGLEYLVEAAKLTINKKDIKFVVIGEGEERPKLENLIKKYGLENNFFLIGEIPDAYKYLKAFDVFVLPSVKEGFPWTVLEAMAAEIPVISTKVGAIPEIMEDRKTGLLVNPGNAEELSEAIRELVNSPCLGNEFINQARRIIEDKLTLEDMIKQIEELL